VEARRVTRSGATTERLDRLPHVLDVLHAVRALVEMPVAASAIVRGQRALEVVGDDVHELAAGHFVVCAHRVSALSI
jgi:hypothetical protein